MPKLPTELPCPVCETGELIFRSTELDVPYFGKTTQTTLLCGSCGYKHNDFILSELKEPMRFELLVESEEDLSIKVVRSASGTISIPELGAKVEPGVASEGYITNIEGVLRRFQDATTLAIRFARETDEEEIAEARGEEVLERLERMIQGKEPVTLIIEDPFGNSAIISEKAIKRVLSEEEVSELKTGMNIVDIIKE